MTQFEESNPKQLKEFIRQLDLLVDEFHPNIYLIEDVFEALDKIKQTINKQLEL
jgi:Holliday junction resolvasome RuvABC endonuclease subunit